LMAVGANLNVTVANVAVPDPATTGRIEDYEGKWGSVGGLGMYESREQKQRPVIEGDGGSADVALASGPGIDRRRVLGSGLAMAATAGLLGAGAAPAARAANM